MKVWQMMRMALLWSWLAAFAAPVLLIAGAEPVTIYLVRHAEKDMTAETGAAMSSVDHGPPLTEAGKARAERLAEIMSATRLNAVWSTQTLRTLDTAAPTAAEQGLDVQIYDARKVHAFADQLKGMSGVLLVIGHSNTLPGLAGALTGHDEGDAFDESDYESLYRVEVNAADEAVAYLLSYRSLALSLE